MDSTNGSQDLLKQAQRSVRKHDYRRAIELFRQVIEQDGPAVEVVDGLATAHFLAGEFEEAAAQWNAQSRDRHVTSPLLLLLRVPGIFFYGVMTWLNVTPVLTKFRERLVDAVRRHHATSF